MIARALAYLKTRNRSTATLFRPAAALIGRLRYAQKFVVVGLVLLVPLGFVVRAYVGLQHDQITATSRERDAARYLRPLVDLLADLVQARHMAVTRGHDDSLDLTADINRMDDIDRRRGDPIGVHRDWQATRGLVIAAIGDHTGKTPEQRFQAYNAASDSIQALSARVGEASRLISDPELDCYYLADILRLRIPALYDRAVRSADRVALPPTGPNADAFDIFVELGMDFGVMSSTRTLIAQAVRAIEANTRDDQVRRTVKEHFEALDTHAAAMGDRLSRAV